jgi:hypothetical protein
VIETTNLIRIRPGRAIACRFRPAACVFSRYFLRPPCLVVFLLLLSIVHAWAGSPEVSPEAPAPLIAIGDVHGAFDDFVAILQHAGLIDSAHHWTGGKTTFVQVGDAIDRGPKPREVLDLLMALENEAPKSGGRVVSLLGNHEVMNIMGDLRYVTPGNFNSFANGESEKRQKSAYEQYAKWRDKHSQLLTELPQPMELTEAEWMARHPVGFIEHREAFSPNGEYGKWLRTHLAVAKIGDVIFLHGGIHPSLASRKVDAVNSTIHDEIKQFDSGRKYMLDEGLILPFFNLQEMKAVAEAEIMAERKSRVAFNQERQARLLQFLKYPEWLSVREDGPLWFRGYDQWSEEEGAAQVEKILEAQKVAHIVVAHTVQKGGRVRPRFGGKVFLIDTGMLSSYYIGGRASALEIRDNAKFTADYMDEQVVLLAPQGGSAQSGAREAPAPPH